MKPLLSLPEVLKQLGGHTAVLYAFGFLAVRARLNALGVWASVPIVDVSYLTEGAVFLLTTSYAIVFPYALTFVVLSLLGWGSYRVASRFYPDLEGCCLRAFGKFEAALQLLALLVVLGLIVSFATDALSIVDLLLAEQKPVPMPKLMKVTLTDPRYRLNAYGAVASLTIASFLVFLWIARSRRLPRFFAGTAGAALALIILLLPLNYAVLLRVQSFPEARILVEENERLTSHQVALLQQAGDQLVARERQSGTIVIIPQDRVKQIQITNTLTLSELWETE